MQKTSEWLYSFSSHKRRVPSKETQTASTCKKISVTGGKGGVGKTSISLRLATDLSQEGHRVLLIDCDANLSNTAIKLGLPLDNSFWKLLSGEKSFKDCVIKPGTFDLLPACNGSLDLFEAQIPLDEVMMDIISSHEHEYDYIILDSPAGMSKETLNLNAYCDHRVIVVTPDKSSITDSYSLIKVLGQKYGIKENHLLVNMIQQEKQFHRVVLSLSETIENFLGCRTVILGGLKKIDIAQESFDTFFLSAASVEWNKNFIKMAQTFTEKPGAPLNAVLPTEEVRLGQDVH
jgi:flagellar biosynthesis protein FlhG